MNQTNLKLKSLGAEEAFYFHYSIDNYTGHKAHSLREFQQELFKVDIKSLEFHLFREDFQNWIRFTLKEEALAKNVETLRKQKITGKLLRNWLYTYVKNHTAHLGKPHKLPSNVRVTQKQKINENKKPLVPPKVTKNP
jgi:hypothetical protein